MCLSRQSYDGIFICTHDIFNAMNKKKIIIYTDGSSLGNPGPGGWGAVIVFTNGKIVELGGKEKNTTNNRMELTAAIEALREIGKTIDEVILYTDSSYTINGITNWIARWQANDWMKRDKTEVLNRDLWENLIDAVSGKVIKWTHVAGHSGMVGNERADDIATSFAEGVKHKLYKGPVSEYGFDITDISYNAKMKSAREKTRTRSKKRAYSYLSLVDGVLARHETWSECEARVKGKRGVKFKKTLNVEDEKSIIKEWGK